MEQFELDIKLLSQRLQRLEEQCGNHHAMLRQWPAEKMRYEMMREQMQKELTDMQSKLNSISDWKQDWTGKVSGIGMVILVGWEIYKWLK